MGDGRGGGWGAKAMAMAMAIEMAMAKPRAKARARGVGERMIERSRFCGILCFFAPQSDSLTDPFRAFLWTPDVLAYLV